MKSKSYSTAITMAFHHENLFPIDCLDILKEIYGKRLDLMSPKTIYSIIDDMMHTQADVDLSDEITKVVNEFINS